MPSKKKLRQLLVNSKAKQAIISSELDNVVTNFNKLQNEYDYLERSHTEYQELITKMVALMVGNLGLDIIKSMSEDHCKEDSRVWNPGMLKWHE